MSPLVLVSGSRVFVVRRSNPANAGVFAAREHVFSALAGLVGVLHQRPMQNTFEVLAHAIERMSESPWITPQEGRAWLDAANAAWHGRGAVEWGAGYVASRSPRRAISRRP